MASVQMKSAAVSELCKRGLDHITRSEANIMNALVNDYMRRSWLFRPKNYTAAMKKAESVIYASKNWFGPSQRAEDTLWLIRLRVMCMISDTIALSEADIQNLIILSQANRSELKAMTITENHHESDQNWQEKAS